MSNELLNLAWAVPLPPGRKFVLVALADAANDEGVCWPSRDELARRTGLSRSSVSEHITALIEDKFIEQARRRHASAVYTVVRDRLAERAQEVQEPDISTPEVQEQDIQNQDVQIPDDPENRRKKSRIPTSLPIPNPQEPSSAFATQKRKSKRASEYTPEFEQWWLIYPRKKDKFKAFRAFRTARKHASLEELLAGAQAYAVEVRGRDQEHIKLATTWLNGHCWESDEPTPVAMTEDSAIGWLRQRWRAADVSEIETRFGLHYEQPDLPPDLTSRSDIDAFCREHRQRWISDHRPTIISQLTKGAS